MNRLNIKQPLGRQWIYDPLLTENQIYDRIDSIKDSFSMYNTFLLYLELIRCNGKDHWRNLTSASQTYNKNVRNESGDDGHNGVVS